MMAAHAIYMTQWGGVKLSTSEAEELQRLDYIANGPGGMSMGGYLSDTVKRCRRKYELKLADIERVAKFKNGYE
jgi:hypothetical protein